MTTTRLNAVTIEQDKNDENKKYFTNIGSVFQHEDGKGFDLKIKLKPAPNKDGNIEFSCFLPEDTENTLELDEATHLIAYAVESKQNDSDDWENYYTKIGAAFPHKKGFNVSLKLWAEHPYKMVLRLPKEKD